jgi:2-polyprenyl-3-methyl-5-hydroxy-6-metoxy-1,4-benzoquinol methylase
MHMSTPVIKTPNLADYAYAHPFATCAHKYILRHIQAAVSERGPGARILDLGCGNGALIGAIRRSSWDMHGVDASISGIEMAQLANPGIRFSVGDVTGPFGSLGLEPGYFDIVMSTEVIEHVYAPRKLAANAFQSLRCGGKFILTTPYHGYLKNVALAVTGKLDRHFTALWDGGHIKFWSCHTLEILLREAGFTQFRFYGAGRLPFLWKSMVIVATKCEE